MTFYEPFVYTFENHIRWLLLAVFFLFVILLSLGRMGPAYVTVEKYEEDLDKQAVHVAAAKAVVDQEFKKIYAVHAKVGIPASLVTEEQCDPVEAASTY